MTKLAILTPKEQRKFDAPPKFHKIDRPRYFSVSPEIGVLAGFRPNVRHIPTGITRSGL